MSKVDAQRAMREARFAAYQASLAGKSGPASPTTPKPPVTAAAKAAAPAAPPAPDQVATPAPASTDPAAEGELCGHRNMGNKTCRRPAGHTEKNHRYS